MGPHIIQILGFSWNRKKTFLVFLVCWMNTLINGGCPLLIEWIVRLNYRSPISASKVLGGGLGGSKILNIGIFKMQPKIVVVLVLGTPEHLELGLILQNWPSTLHFNFCRFYTVKTAKKRQKKPKNGNCPKFHQMVQNAQFKSQFQHFWGILGV